MAINPLTASITGQIESAMLVVHDYREYAKSLGKQNSKMDQSSKLLNIQSQRLAQTAQALDEDDFSFPDFAQSKNKYYHVQFNPSELTINASILPVSKTDASDPAKAREEATEDTRLNLTLYLYFDEMRIYDAFMWEKYTAGLSAQGIANLANFAKESMGKTWSVQHQVEGLLSALRNPYTRNVSFRWADFCFIGQMNTVQAQYTMFSPAGRPVRAQVLLRLHHELDPVMLGLWDRDFEFAFGRNVRVLSRTEQGVSNLLNLGL